MKIVLWILGILVLLGLLFCLLRLGILVTFAPGQASVDIWIGPFRVRVAPTKAKKGKAAPAKEKPKKEKNPAEKFKQFSKPTLRDLKDAYTELWPPMKRALARTCRGVRIRPFRLFVILAGAEDPAAAAELYGAVNAAVWTALPPLQQLLVIPDPQIHVGLDFDAGRTAVSGTVGVSARIGTLLAIGAGAGVPALRWFFKYQKRKKNAAPKDKKTDQPTDAAA